MNDLDGIIVMGSQEMFDVCLCNADVAVLQNLLIPRSSESRRRNDAGESKLKEKWKSSKDLHRGESDGRPTGSAVHVVVHSNP